MLGNCIHSFNLFTENEKKNYIYGTTLNVVERWRKIRKRTSERKPRTDSTDGYSAAKQMKLNLFVWLDVDTM